MATVRQELEEDKIDEEKGCGDIAALPGVSERQAAFRSSLAAAGREAGNASHSTSEVVEEDKQLDDGTSPSPVSRFSQVLSLFIADAEEKLHKLKTSAQASQEASTAAAAWLGESPDLDTLPIFQTIRSFITQFDQAFAKVHRLGAEAIPPPRQLLEEEGRARISKDDNDE